PLPTPLDSFYTLYEAQRGDTLESVARWFGVKPDAIVPANGTRDPVGLRPGALLKVPTIQSAGVVVAAPSQPPPPPGPGTTPFKRGSVGYDVSYPQGNGPYPAQPYAFGLVGVTRGRAFARNPNLRQQLAWAQPSGNLSLYMNL